MSDWLHQLMLQAGKQNQQSSTLYYGHVSTYDPKKHAVKVIIPHMMDDDADEPVETGWVPVATNMVGDGWGIQWAPKGGATKDELEKGEQVQIHVVDSEEGMFATAQFAFHKKALPPGKGKEDEEEGGEGEEEEEDPEEEEPDEDELPDPKGEDKLEGGEFILKHESGSFLKFYKDGRVQINVKDNLDAVVQKDLNVVVKEGDANVKVKEGDGYVLLREGDLDVELELGDATCKAWIGDIKNIAETGDIKNTALLGNIEAYAPLGNIKAESELGDIELITELGNIIAETLGSVIISGAISVDIISEALVTITAPFIQAGESEAIMMELCTVIFLELFNMHTHTVPGGISGPPEPQAEPLLHTTINFTAS